MSRKFQSSHPSSFEMRTFLYSYIAFSRVLSGEDDQSHEDIFVFGTAVKDRPHMSSQGLYLSTRVVKPFF
jgi:hypothetical protein